MIAGGIKTREEIETELKKMGYEPTDTATDGGRFWRAPNGKHLHVPDAYFDMYPDFILGDLLKRAEYIKNM